MNGAQLERTALSWRRTLVSFTIVALLLARLAATEAPRPVAVLAILAVGLLWAGAVHAVRLRIRSLAVPAGRTLPLVVGLVVLYGTMGTLLLVS